MLLVTGRVHGEKKSRECAETSVKNIPKQPGAWLGGSLETRRLEYIQQKDTRDSSTRW